MCNLQRNVYGMVSFQRTALDFVFQGLTFIESHNDIELHRRKRV